MEEKIICKSAIDNAASTILKCLFIVPAVLIIISFATGEPFDFSWFPGWLLIGGVLLAIGIWIFIFALNSCSMVITDKRVYGKATFGRQVDLPLDMISAASTGSLKSVGVSTASGRISFWLLENKEELYTAITKLLLKRQKGTANISEKSNSADEIKKYKELLDDGIITQEEFDAKKKQILGL